MDPINGGDERDILVTLFVESMKAGIEEFIEGDEYEKGKIIGKYLCDIVTCFIGVVKGVKAGSQLVKELKNAGSLSNLIRAGLNKTAGNLKNSADEIARSIKAAGEAIQNIIRIMKGADVKDLVNYTKKITVYDDYAEFVTKDGALFKMTRSEVPEGNFSKLDALIDEVEEIDKIAQAAYNSIRSRGLDINAIRTISANTGLSESEVTTLVQHVFLNKHLIPQSGGNLVKYTYLLLIQRLHMRLNVLNRDH